MKPIVILLAAVGGLAVWRRKSLGSDAGKAATAVKSLPSKVKARAGDKADAVDADAVDTEGDGVVSGTDETETSESPDETAAAGTA